MIKCNFCEKSFPDVNSLLRHLYKHGYNSESYFLDFKGKRGLCKMCGKPTRYINYVKGYRLYCSKKCAGLDTLNKSRSTKLAKYGDPNFTNQEKRQNTLRNKHDTRRI